LFAEMFYQLVSCDLYELNSILHRLEINLKNLFSELLFRCR